LNRWDAQFFVPDVCWAAIQIATFGDWPKINKTKLMDHIQLAFVDVNSEKLARIEQNPRMMETKNKEWFLFDKSHANTILDFVKKNKNEIDLLFVHCEAGISRSPAVAAAISRIYFNDDAEWFKMYKPNDLVYKIILETAKERGEYNGNQGI
jgi:predicted protein tyrosine phosphatase